MVVFLIFDQLVGFVQESLEAGNFFGCQRMHLDPLWDSICVGFFRKETSPRWLEIVKTTVEYASRVEPGC
jgi:hypothetical protein